MTGPRAPHQRPALADHQQRMTRRQWAERFGIYFLGVAIGLVLVGLLWMGRKNATQPGGPGGLMAPPPNAVPTGSPTPGSARP